MKDSKIAESPKAILANAILLMVLENEPVFSAVMRLEIKKDRFKIQNYDCKLTTPVLIF
jgi:hypothetical protein